MAEWVEVQCVGDDGFGGCDHVVFVTPEAAGHVIAYCDMSCYIGGGCRLDKEECESHQEPFYRGREKK